MSRHRTPASALALAPTAALALPTFPAGAAAPRGVTPFAIPTDTRDVTHALNRMAYGPRRGDVSRVQHMGLAAYIEQQLRPRPTFLARTAHAAARRNKVLIAAFQRGAADGLDVVVPVGERAYYAARRSIAGVAAERSR